ncbi:MAG: hypothetical protein IPI32_15480 [Austwickia sp.]|nr:hypothetical protein [Austwickia sp.]MBK8435582.1 hypothetical protein [Austwickia sp.]MBK9100848.1 hypothetical protein [Austwickia sp.]
MTGSTPSRPRDDDPQDAIDAAFEDIVARFTAPEPAVDPVDPVDPGSEPSGPDEVQAAALPLASSAQPPPGWRVHSPPEDPEDEVYRPPAPRPLPAQDATFWVALVGGVGGPLFFLYLVLTDPYGSRLALFAAGLVTILGLAVTFWRLPSRAERDPDDDGARV